MADILLDVQSAPATPSAGQGVIYLDTTSKMLFTKDDSGLYHGAIRRAAVAAQGAGFATDTYVTNSGLLIPGFGMQAGMTFQWEISASKSGASTATPVYTVRIGSAQSTADTARLTLTGPAQTAIADIGSLFISVTVRSVGGAGVLQGTAFWSHRGTAASTTVSGTGFANDVTGHVEGTSAGYDNSSQGGLYAGLSINGGTSSSWTLTQCIGSLEC